jgi:hypothetical protein
MAMVTFCRFSILLVSFAAYVEAAAPTLTTLTVSGAVLPATAHFPKGWSKIARGYFTVLPITAEAAAFTEPYSALPLQLLAKRSGRRR